MHISVLAAALMLPALLSSQARYQPDPSPARSPDWDVAGAQVKQLPARAPRRPMAAQFDSLGTSPLGSVGDTVTVFYFPDGANLRRSGLARITGRQRFLPPLSWRASCDQLAHPGWMFSLDAPATSAFAVVVPGVHSMPAFREPPPLARAAGLKPFHTWADSVWRIYNDRIKPGTERAYAFLWYSFFRDEQDAGWSKTKLWGLRGPEGRNYAVFSVWMRDDSKDGTPNTTATWIIDGWGMPVARAPGNVDIYGVTDSNGDNIDEVVTSSGLIRWNGIAWSFPTVYSDEPCMTRRVLPPPPGVRP